MLRLRARFCLINFLVLSAIPFLVSGQNNYYDLEKVKVETQNKFLVTANSLQVRIKSNKGHYKVSAGTPFYTLKKGDIVNVYSGRKGTFAGVNSDWYEVSYSDPKTGTVKWIDKPKNWHSLRVWGIVDAKYLKEIKKTFFTINQDYVSIKIGGRSVMDLSQGDTIIAEDFPFKNKVHVALVKNNKQIWFSKPVAGGGSTRGGTLDNSVLDKIENQDSLRGEDFEVIGFVSERQQKSYLSSKVIGVLFVFFLLGTFVFVFISWNKPTYSFNFDSFKIDKKHFRIDVIKGKVIDINRYQRAHYTSTSGSVYQTGNTINVTAPRVDVTTSNHSEIWIVDNNGQEHLVTRNYDINSARVGSTLSWLKLSNGVTLGLLYHNLGRYNYTSHSYLKNVIDSAVSRKFNMVKFGSVLLLFAICLYFILKLGFSRYNIKNELFGYDDPSTIFFGLTMKTYVFQFIIFSALLLLSYYVILSIKRRIALKRVAKRLEKDVIALCEKLT